MVSAHCGVRLGRALQLQFGAYPLALAGDELVPHPNIDLHWTLWPPGTGSSGHWPNVRHPPGAVHKEFTTRRDIRPWQPGDVNQKIHFAHNMSMSRKERSGAKRPQDSIGRPLRNEKPGL